VEEEVEGLLCRQTAIYDTLSKNTLRVPLWGWCDDCDFGLKDSDFSVIHLHVRTPDAVAHSSVNAVR